MPPNFEYPRGVDFWVPIGADAARLLRARGIPIFSVLGKLRPKTSVEQAQTELDVLSSQSKTQYPATNERVRFKANGMRRYYVGDNDLPLFALFGSALALLVIACLNVSCLLLGRAKRRRREMSIRSTLGALPGNLVGQMMSEGFILATVAEIVGLGLVAILDDQLVMLLPRSMELFTEVTINLNVLAFAAATTLLVGVGFIVVPAWHAVSQTALSGLREGRTTSFGHSTTWSMLVAIQVALSVALCISAGLVIVAAVNVLGEDPGFDSDGVTALEVRLDPARYQSGIQKVGFYRELLRHIQGLPGTDTTGSVTFLPLSDSQAAYQIEVPGRVQEQQSSAAVHVVGGEYFETLHIPFRSGRLFTSLDAQSRAQVMWPS